MFADDGRVALYGCYQNPAKFKGTESDLEYRRTAGGWEEELAPKYVVETLAFIEIPRVALPKDNSVIYAKCDGAALRFFYKIGCNINTHCGYIWISAKCA